MNYLCFRRKDPCYKQKRITKEKRKQDGSRNNASGSHIFIRERIVGWWKARDGGKSKGPREVKRTRGWADRGKQNVSNLAKRKQGERTSRSWRGILISAYKAWNGMHVVGTWCSRKGKIVAGPEGTDMRMDKHLRNYCKTWDRPRIVGDQSFLLSRLFVVCCLLIDNRK